MPKQRAPICAKSKSSCRELCCTHTSSSEPVPQSFQGTNPNTLTWGQAHVPDAVLPIQLPPLSPSSWEHHREGAALNPHCRASPALGELGVTCAAHQELRGLFQTLLYIDSALADWTVSGEKTQSTALAICDFWAEGRLHQQCSQELAECYTQLLGLEKRLKLIPSGVLLLYINTAFHKPHGALWLPTQQPYLKVLLKSSLMSEHIWLRNRGLAILLYLLNFNKDHSKQVKTLLFLRKTTLLSQKTDSSSINTLYADKKN